MEMLQRIRGLSPAHDVVFLIEDAPACDTCDDGDLPWGVYRRLWRTFECVRVARAPDIGAALEFLRAEVDAIQLERETGEVVKSR